MHIISTADFPLFCSNSARKCLIMPAECSPQKSLIMLEILPAEFIQAYQRATKYIDQRHPDLVSVLASIAKLATNKHSYFQAKQGFVHAVAPSLI